MKYRLSWSNRKFGSVGGHVLLATDSTDSKIFLADSDNCAIETAITLIGQLTVHQGCGSFKLVRIDVEEVSTSINLALFICR